MENTQTQFQKEWDIFLVQLKKRKRTLGLYWNDNEHARGRELFLRSYCHVYSELFTVCLSSSTESRFVGEHTARDQGSQSFRMMIEQGQGE